MNLTEAQYARLIGEKPEKKAKQPKDKKATRPLTEILVTATKDRMHRYHCPVHGETCAPCVGRDSWTPEEGRRGYVKFACGHMVEGAL